MTTQSIHPSASAFAKTADEVCRAIENRDGLSPLDQLRAIHASLSQAYAAALQLTPSEALDGEEDVERPSEEPVVPNLEDLAELLAEKRYYREIFDPHLGDADQEVTGDLLDDFGDIYRDLARGLGHWRDGSTAAAVWEWRFSFATHWGEHATSAMRALYALSAWHGVPWPIDGEGAAR